VAGPRPSLAVALLGAVLLLWPTVLNWHPYLFWDSYGYFLQGKAYARLILGWTGWWPVPAEAGQGWIGAAGRMLASDPAIRSPTWSLPFYGLAATGGFWLVAALDALVAAASLDLALARLLGLTAGRRLAVLVVMAAATSLPWFASYLMPDLYAGLLILAAATLAFAWAGLRRRERLWLLALYLLAITFHSSHLLLAAGLVVLAFVLPAAGTRLGRAARLGLPLVGAVLLLLAANGLAFGQATLTPQGPPFLLARSWEDGPARAYLAASCGRERRAICAWIDRLDPSAQEFLWGAERSYWAMDLETRAAVRAEETAILAQALAADPWGQAWASLRNAGRQLARFGLDDFVLGRGAVVTPEDYAFVYLPETPAAVHGLGWFTGLVHASTAAGLAVLLGWLARRRAAAADPVLAPVGLVLLGLLLNAAVCGVLSGPHDRYQARTIWLVPLLAAGLALRPAPPVRTAPSVSAPEAL
jgi:hypothetical protein